MKVFNFIFPLIAIIALSSCREDAIGDSGIEIPSEPQTELDKWIDTTFRAPYNVYVQYRWNNNLSDVEHITVPPREELVQPFLKAVLKIWLTPYIRVAESHEDFMKDYICRQLFLVGSGSYNAGGSVTLGLAAAGYRITLFTVNQFDLENGGVGLASLQRFFQTMHHEFGHILNQRKPYDANFQRITGNYTADWTILTDEQARELGFISAYARSAHIEDFVEVLSHYITYTETEWQNLMNSIKNVQAREYIRLKQLSVSSYMKNTYGVNMLELRKEVTSAIAEVANGDLGVKN
jgi:substrate import-associated zinc metallohydrolase lipoprotein